jgi:hypothetical protein
MSAATARFHVSPTRWPTVAVAGGGEGELLLLGGVDQGFHRLERRVGREEVDGDTPSRNGEPVCGLSERRSGTVHRLIVERDGGQASDFARNHQKDTDCRRKSDASCVRRM